jgi:hypothetical protein
MDPFTYKECAADNRSPEVIRWRGHAAELVAIAQCSGAQGVGGF